MGIEAIVRQRDKETTAANIAKLSGKLYLQNIQSKTVTFEINQFILPSMPSDGAILDDIVILSSCLCRIVLYCFVVAAFHVFSIFSIRVVSGSY